MGALPLISLISDSELLYLVRECRELADHFGTKFMGDILENRSKMSMKSIKKVAEGW